jgi:hypothetical protein
VQTFKVPPVPRCWVVISDGTELIHRQKDRFIKNCPCVFAIDPPNRAKSGSAIGVFAHSPPPAKGSVARFQLASEEFSIAQRHGAKSLT